jgi:hypothetical protein
LPFLSNIIFAPIVIIAMTNPRPMIAATATTVTFFINRMLVMVQ